MSSKTDREQIPQNAFLIVNGAEIVVLEKAIINIGRMSDNDLVISDTRISRYHAQLRAENGVYVIVDLNSTGGTSIGGANVTKSPLKAGDVITLAGIPLLYGQSTLSLMSEEKKRSSPSLKSVNPTVTDTVDVEPDRYLDMFDTAEEDLTD